MDGRKTMKWDGEAKTHERVVQYLRVNYPGVLFRTDFAAGIKLPPWLARRQKILQQKRGFPDLFVYHPTRHHETCELRHGLAVELKALGIKLKTRDGRWADEHFQRQYEVLKDLNDKGYTVAFARGYEEACAVLDWYLSGSQEVDFDDDFIPTVRNAEDLESEIF